MSTLPDNVTYGTVTGRFVVDGPDGVDVIAAGKVRFLPAPRRLSNFGSDPATVIELDPLIYDLDGDGDLADADGNKSVSLVATDNPEIGPVDWTWGVIVSLEGQAVTRFDIAVAAGSVIDLTTVIPTASSVGVTPAVVVVDGGGGTSGDVLFHWEGTQAQYDALGTWDDDTMYVIVADDVGPATTVPGPPLSVVALAGDTTATITWAPPALGSPPTGYYVQRSTVSTGGFATLANGTLPSTTLNFLDQPLTNGVTFYYQMVAFNSVGTGAPSSVVSVMPDTVHPTVPGVPTSFTAQSGPSSVTVNWLAPTSNGNSTITGYTVQRSLSATTGFTNIATVNGTTFSYLSSGLTNGTSYYFKVFATNAVGDGTATTTVTGIPTTAATVPGAPTGVAAVAGPASVTVNWTTPPDGGATINAYMIERSILPTTGFATIGTIPAFGAATTFISTNLSAGTTYYFRVIAQNAIGAGPASSIVNAVPTALGGTVPALWQDAVDTGDIDIVSGWYDANTGWDTEGVVLADLWGPGQSGGFTIDSAWLTANAAPGKVVFASGRWTVSKLHCEYVFISVSNITFSHCYIDRPNTGQTSGINTNGTATGIIIDHCTCNGNFGQGLLSDTGDATGYVNTSLPTTADQFTMRYCELTAYRAAALMYNGCTLEYNWVHDLYIFGESHNTACSLRWGYNRIYRNFLNDGTSSALSLYAENTPFSPILVEGNIFSTHGHSIYEVLFPSDKTYVNLSTTDTRRLIDNYFDLGTASDIGYFSETHNNTILSTGAHIFGDDGAAAVTNEPRLLKFVTPGNFGKVDRLSTVEFTPSANSTILVFTAIMNAGITVTQAPTVTVTGQYTPFPLPAKLLETTLNTTWGGPGYAFQCSLWKYETGSTVSFSHVTVDPFTTADDAYFAVWVYEVVGRTGMTLLHSSLATNAAGWPSTVDTITSGALSGAATSGKLCMAFGASANTSPPGVWSTVSGWNQIGIENDGYIADYRNIIGCAYWRTNFTGTTMTVADLGTGSVHAGLILTEWN